MIKLIAKRIEPIVTKRKVSSWRWFVKTNNIIEEVIGYKIIMTYYDDVVIGSVGMLRVGHIINNGSNRFIVTNFSMGSIILETLNCGSNFPLFVGSEFVIEASAYMENNNTQTN